MSKEKKKILWSTKHLHIVNKKNKKKKKLFNCNEAVYMYVFKGAQILSGKIYSLNTYINCLQSFLFSIFPFYFTHFVIVSQIHLKFLNFPQEQTNNIKYGVRYYLGAMIFLLS